MPPLTQTDLLARQRELQQRHALACQQLAMAEAQRAEMQKAIDQLQGALGLVEQLLSVSVEPEPAPPAEPPPSE